MPNYQNGKIYKIYCNLTGDTYYGSTVQPLTKRVSKHKNSFKRWKDGNAGYVKSYDIIERGDYTYSLVEHFPCDSKIELHARERYWIENNQCVNKVVPGRTDKEYYEDNKEHILERVKEHSEANKEKKREYMKEYSEANKEKILAYKKEYYEANKERLAEKNKEHYEQNKERINEKNKEHYEQNKERINEERREKVVCDCGSEVRKDGLPRHLRSKKHLDWVEAECE